MNSDLPETLEEACARLARREVSSAELAQAALDALGEMHIRLNIAARIEPEGLEQARAVDGARAQGRPVGPLQGVPLAHKDIFRRANGAPVSCGSKIGWFDPPGEGPWLAAATAPARLRAAGAVEIGALSMVEFAVGPTGHNASFGDALNPWDPARIPGGSSSGSGVAVSTGAVLGSLGTDTGGSIRQPAHFCAVVGLKPTAGLISRAGAFPSSATLDTVGPLARSVRDCALLTELAAGPDPADPDGDRAAPEILSTIEDGVRGMSLGVGQGAFLNGVEPRIGDLVAQSAALLGQAGARLQTVDLGDMAAISTAGDTVSAYEIGRTHREMFAARPLDYPALVRVRLAGAQTISKDAYRKGLNARAGWRAWFIERALAGCDVLILPTVEIFAPAYAALDALEEDELRRTVARYTRLNRPFNYLGLPSLAIPMATEAGEMPAAFQLVGRPGAEPLLFRAGRAFERLVRSRPPRPPISVWS